MDTGERFKTRNVRLRTVLNAQIKCRGRQRVLRFAAAPNESFYFDFVPVAEVNSTLTAPQEGSAVIKTGSLAASLVM